METTYLIDTNILVYAYNEDTSFHEKDTIITANDKHFRSIKEINVLNPFKSIR